MSFVKLILGLLDLERNIRLWRLNLCFFAGAVLAIGVIILVNRAPLCWIPGGMMLAVRAVIGWIWDDRACKG